MDKIETRGKSYFFDSKQIGRSCFILFSADFDRLVVGAETVPEITVNNSYIEVHFEIIMSNRNVIITVTTEKVLIYAVFDYVFNSKYRIYFGSISVTITG